VFGTYRAVFRAPGTAAFSSAAFLMRLPIAVYPLALILLVATHSHHYGFAGALSGSYVAGLAVGGPIGARLVDRLGQRRVIVPATAVHACAVSAIVVLVEAGLPDWTLLPPAFVAGFSFLEVGALVRARWSFVLAGRPELTTAYSVESTFDEVIFVVGPLIATVLAVEVSPLTPIILAAVLVAAGAGMLGRLRDSAPPAHLSGEARTASALRSQGMVMIVCVAASMGAIFASAEVAAVAFCGQHGHQGLAGYVLSAFALSSALAGFVYGTRQWRAALLDRFRTQTVIFGVLPCVLLLTTNVETLAVLMFVVGLGTAPTLITAFGLVSEIVPGRALTEGLAWLVTGLNVGYGAASALSGRLADAHGARITFLVTVGAGVLMAVAAVRLHAILRQPVAPPMSPARGTID
jgi:MFS family permease